MTPSDLVLAIHFAVIAFNVVGLIAIPLGAAFGWRFVRAPTWRVLHALSWGIVALQAVAGRACFLTDWQYDLAGGEGNASPLVARLINAVIYWPLPLWVFAICYAAIFAIVLALFWIIPTRRISR